MIVQHCNCEKGYFGKDKMNRSELYEIFTNFHNKLCISSLGQLVVLELINKTGKRTV